MDEASSRFVDQLVMDKLVREKLEKVHHYPTVKLDQINPDLFNDFSSIDRNAVFERCSLSGESVMKSPVYCEYKENQTVRIKSFNAKNPRATILFMHGLFEDNRDIYTFVFKELNKAGYSIKLMTLPFHYERKPAESLFSGEYFWSADIIRTRNAFKQAVYEMYQSYIWLKNNSTDKVFVAGFSMGASVSFMMSVLCSEIDGLFVINPAAALSDIVWESPLCRTIKQDFLASGYSLEDLSKIYRQFEPVSSDGLINRDKIFLVYALYDLVNDQIHYQRLIEKWKLPNYLAYKAGHLNTLRVPRLADDIASFFNKIGRSNK